ncbi:MAG: ABC transporter substrate-binding protein [Microthrixaceae bacterium]|nr:ABC transporter substrate-binding protein [Microthrixaceae bacterium]
MRAKTIGGIWFVSVAFVALLAASCGADDDGGGDATGSTASTSEETAPSGGETFGDMESPCGEGKFTVDPEQAAGTSDVLRLGVANDRSSQIYPGLNKEVWDASNAFVAWCNDQGGIGGLPIEIVDLDSHLWRSKLR